jgi:hypothetical protein
MSEVANSDPSPTPAQDSSEDGAAEVAEEDADVAAEATDGPEAEEEAASPRGERRPPFSKATPTG